MLVVINALVSRRRLVTRSYALADHGVTRATAVATLARIGNSGGLALLLVTLAALLLAPVVLGLGLWRAGRAPWWLAAVWVFSTVVFLVTETTKLGDLVGFGAMMAVLAALGIAAATEPSAVAAPATA